MTNLYGTLQGQCIPPSMFLYCATENLDDCLGWDRCESRFPNCWLTVSSRNGRIVLCFDGVINLRESCHDKFIYYEMRAWGCVCLEIKTSCALLCPVHWQLDHLSRNRTKKEQLKDSDSSRRNGQVG